jgi:hypothetical protein
VAALGAAAGLSLHGQRRTIRVPLAELVALTSFWRVRHPTHQRNLRSAVPLLGGGAGGVAASLERKAYLDFILVGRGRDLGPHRSPRARARDLAVSELDDGYSSGRLIADLVTWPHAVNRSGPGCCTLTALNADNHGHLRTPALRRRWLSGRLRLFTVPVGLRANVARQPTQGSRSRTPRGTTVPPSNS